MAVRYLFGRGTAARENVLDLGKLFRQEMEEKGFIVEDRRGTTNLQISVFRPDMPVEFGNHIASLVIHQPVPSHHDLPNEFYVQLNAGTSREAIIFDRLIDTLCDGLGAKKETVKERKI